MNIMIFVIQVNSMIVVNVAKLVILVFLFDILFLVIQVNLVILVNIAKNLIEVKLGDFH